MTREPQTVRCWCGDESETTRPHTEGWDIGRLKPEHAEDWLCPRCISRMKGE